MDAKQKRLIEKHRETTCRGCSQNRYNYKSDGVPNVEAPTSGEGCWNLGCIKRGKCSLYRR